MVGFGYSLGQQKGTQSRVNTGEKNGRHEETRTPDLYRVNSVRDLKRNDTE